MLIDSHCHLNMLDLDLFSGEMAEVLKAANREGVERFICVSVTLKDFPALCDIAQRFPAVSISLGLHPNEQADVEPNKEDLIKLAKENPTVATALVAIGETGLDRFYNPSDEQYQGQKERFCTHIQAAKALDLPLIVHTRDAREDTIAILKEQGADSVGGVSHCFTENWEMAKAALELNFYISFSGIVTFKNATDLKEIAKKIPLDRMLVETDCPYLAPVPFRGKPNQPAYVRFVAQTIADLRGDSFERIAEATTENCMRLFKLSGIQEK